MERYVAIKDDFSPEELNILQQVFDALSRKLKADDDQESRRALARSILEAAAFGVKDAETLMRSVKID